MYGLPDWNDAVSKGVYQGEWAEFRDGEAEHAFDRFPPYTYTESKGGGTSCGYAAEDISQACHRLLGMVDRFASAPTISKGAIRSGWFYLPKITTPGLDPWAQDDGGSDDADRSERAQALTARDEDRPDQVLLRSQSYSAAIFEPWFQGLAPNLRPVLFAYTIPKLTKPDSSEGNEAEESTVTYHSAGAELGVSHQTIKNRHDAIVASLRALLTTASRTEQLAFFAFLYSQVENAGPRGLSPTSDDQGGV